MRKRPGMAGIRADQARRENLRVLGSELNKETVASMEAQLSSFRAELRRFAAAHGSEIQSNPVFRAKFHDMCGKLGVDPLASRKGVWAQLLPSMGDFYYVLGTRIVEVCLATRKVNGGIISVDGLLARLRRHQDRNMDSLTAADVGRAVNSLARLGSGFELVDVGKGQVVRSVPLELSEDHTTVLNLCRGCGWVTKEGIVRELKWTERRAEGTIAFLMEKELAWIDVADGVTSYWVLGLIPEKS